MEVTNKMAEIAMLMLKNRAQRLVRLLELNAPAVILCNEAMLVYRAACGLDPALAGEALAGALRRYQAMEQHICTICFNTETKPEDSHVCSKCAEEIVKDSEYEDEESS